VKAYVRIPPILQGISPLVCLTFLSFLLFSYALSSIPIKPLPVLLLHQVHSVSCHNFRLSWGYNQAQLFEDGDENGLENNISYEKDDNKDNNSGNGVKSASVFFASPITVKDIIADVFWR
jgi:hypothetical protein